MRLSYDTRGEGARIAVLLHGFLGSGRNLASLARRLADTFPMLTVVTPDLTGHGSSPPLPRGATLATMAQDVLESTRHFAGPLTGIGHSLGGRVLLAARLLEPERFSHLALLDVT